MELAQDAGFDFPAYIAGRFGVRIGRLANAKFTTGAGTTESFGFLSRASSAVTVERSNAKRRRLWREYIGDR